MRPTLEQIQETYNKLPSDMQAAISDDAVQRNIETIGSKYSLRMDKIDLLSKEVAMVMLGFKKTNEFIRSLVSELDVDKETAESIAIDVDNEVFKKIRESLRSVQYGETAEHDKAHEDAVPSPARDSLLKEIEDHASDEQTAGPADISSSFTGDDYNPASFASSVEPQSTPAPQRDTYREPITFEPNTEPQDPLPAPETPYERAQPTQPEVAPKSRINNDPYRESIE